MGHIKSWQPRRGWAGSHKLGVSKLDDEVSQKLFEVMRAASNKRCGQDLVKIIHHIYIKLMLSDGLSHFISRGLLGKIPAGKWILGAGKPRGNRSEY